MVSQWSFVRRVASSSRSVEIGWGFSTLPHLPSPPRQDSAAKDPVPKEEEITRVNGDAGVGGDGGRGVKRKRSPEPEPDVEVRHNVERQDGLHASQGGSVEQERRLHAEPTAETVDPLPQPLSGAAGLTALAPPVEYAVDEPEASVAEHGASTFDRERSPALFFTSVNDSEDGDSDDTELPRESSPNSTTPSSLGSAKKSKPNCSKDDDDDIVEEAPRELSPALFVDRSTTPRSSAAKSESNDSDDAPAAGITASQRSRSAALFWYAAPASPPSAPSPPSPPSPPILPPPPPSQPAPPRALPASSAKSVKRKRPKLKHLLQHPTPALTHSELRLIQPYLRWPDPPASTLTPQDEDLPPDDDGGMVGECAMWNASTLETCRRLAGLDSPDFEAAEDEEGWGYGWVDEALPAASWDISTPSNTASGAMHSDVWSDMSQDAAPIRSVQLSLPPSSSPPVSSPLRDKGKDWTGGFPTPPPTLPRPNPATAAETAGTPGKGSKYTRAVSRYMRGSMRNFADGDAIAFANSVRVMRSLFTNAQRAYAYLASELRVHGSRLPQRSAGMMEECDRNLAALERLAEEVADEVGRVFPPLLPEEEEEGEEGEVVFVGATYSA